MDIRRTIRIPDQVKRCILCDRMCLHAAIVTADRDGDGVLTEADAVWVPKKRHKADCDTLCAASLSHDIPDEKNHGYKGKCPVCGEV